MKQIVLDTETTGLDPQQGHRIIEIGCVEIENRRLTGRHFHCYLNPDRDIDEGAVEVHGITREFLKDKPRFPKVAQEFIDFVNGHELIIHNAPFDVGFLNNEIKLMQSTIAPLEKYCGIIDSLVLARQKHPGQRNSLDALCKRYEVDNSQRELHGALLDAEILADVYLAMTGGQTRFQLGDESVSQATSSAKPRLFDGDRPALRVIQATELELSEHQQRLTAIDSESEGGCVWLGLDNAAT